MTVREAAKVLKTAKAIMLGYGGNAVQFDKDDALMMDAYGKYVVDEIKCVDDDCYEVNIVMIPMKEGA